VRLIAAALTGNPVVVAESHRETRGVRMADGTGGCIEVRAYANAAAEAVSAAITDAEVVQAIGRARGINRTAADPVRVWLMADVATPLVVDELLDWRDLAPSAVERMACRGIFLTSPADAARAYPDLFTSEEAARKAIKRGAGSEGYFPDIPLRRNPLRGMSAKSALQFSYRPPGRGQQTRQGWARPDMDPEDVWRWLESHLGELAVFTPAEPAPDAPAAVPEKASQIETPLGGGAAPRRP
jgi:putative DNA primase/helicase